MKGVLSMKESLEKEEEKALDWWGISRQSSTRDNGKTMCLKEKEYFILLIKMCRNIQAGSKVEKSKVMEQCTIRTEEKFGQCGKIKGQLEVNWLKIWKGSPSQT